MEKCVINNPDRKRQIINFSGIMDGNLSATDIDGFIEYHDKLFILFEGKTKYGKMELGQRLALERLVDNSKKPMVLFVFRHDEDATDEIIASECVVDMIYYKGKWVTPTVMCKLGARVRRFIDYIEKQT